MEQRLRKGEARLTFEIILYLLNAIRRGRNVLGTITSVRTRRPFAALTFDDGPHPTYTPLLLDILDRHDAKATFFLLGSRATRYPRIVKNIAERGHTVANHSWDHPSLPHLSTVNQLRQIIDCQRALNPWGRKLFRPPYGHQGFWPRLYAAVLGYKVIAWSVHGRDWLNDDSIEIYGKLISKVQAGSIVLLHDSLETVAHENYLSRIPTLEAVDMLLDATKGKIHFVTVPELLDTGRIVKERWYKKGDVSWLNSLTKRDR
ncbi:MAG: polysaccharide deacetylase family protein [Gammaproteobacteria bacterium]